MFRFFFVGSCVESVSAWSQPSLSQTKTDSWDAEQKREEQRVLELLEEDDSALAKSIEWEKSQRAEGKKVRGGFSFSSLLQLDLKGHKRPEQAPEELIDGQKEIDMARDTKEFQRELAELESLRSEEDKLSADEELLTSNLQTRQSRKHRKTRRAVHDSESADLR